MAYTPSAATKAALAKAKAGQPLSATDQLFIKMYNNAMLSEMTSNPSATPASTDAYAALRKQQSGAVLTKQESDTLNAHLSKVIGPTWKPVDYTDGNSPSSPTNTGVVRAQPITAYPNQGNFTVTDPSIPNPPIAINPGIPSQPGQGGLNVTGSTSSNDLFPSAPVTYTSPSGGVGGTGSEAGRDVQKLIAEAELQKSLNKQAYDSQADQRKQYLSELSDLLIKQQQAQLNDQMPGIYEDLNTRGLLRSSALGEKVGLEASKLARQTSEQLALQGLTDRNNALTQSGKIEDQYLAGRNAAIQRGFSVEDFNRQAALSREIGTAVTPVSQNGGKGGQALSGALGGASIGANFGAPGAAVGGVLGGVLGSATGKSK